MQYLELTGYFFLEMQLAWFKDSFKPLGINVLYLRSLKVNLKNTNQEHIYASALILPLSTDFLYIQALLQS